MGLDSGTSAEFQWHLMADTTTPAGEAQQDSAWITMLSTWESSTPARLLIIDGTPRSYAYAREHLRLSSVWGMREVSAKEAKALTSDSAAANGAVVIVTKAHAPAAR